MHIPAIDDLVRDPDLSGAPTRVYLYLIRYLDAIEYRPLKQWAVAQQLKMKRDTISRALSLLVDGGYLELGEWDWDRHSRVYRIVLDRAPLTDSLAPGRPRKAG